MRRHFRTYQRIRFRRFAKTRWAAFASMHREVTIGRVSADIANMAMHKVAEAMHMMQQMLQLTIDQQADELATDNLLQDELQALFVPARVATCAPASRAHNARYIKRSIPTPGSGPFRIPTNQQNNKLT